MANNLRAFGIGALGTLQQNMQNRQKQQQEIEQMILKARIEQQMNPLSKILEMGKLAEALQSLGIDPQTVMGGSMPQGQIPFGQQRPQMPMQRPMPQMGIAPYYNAQGRDIGNTPQGMPRVNLGQANIKPTEFKQTPFGGLQPTKFEDIGAQMEKTKMGEAAKLSTKQTESFLTTRQNMGRLAGSFSELVANMKLMEKEQGGLGIGPGVKGQLGRLGARIKGESDPTKAFSGISGFEGQLSEVAISLSPMLTGQNRIIKSIVSMIKKTLPTTTATGPEATRLLRQSVTNSFRIMLAIQKNALSPEEINLLNQQDEGTITSKLEQLSKSVTLTPQENILLNQMWNRIKSTPASKPETLFPTGQGTTSFKVLRRLR